MNMPIHTCAVIGLGGVGRSFIAAAAIHQRWRVRRICDLRQDLVDAAISMAPDLIGGTDVDAVLSDPQITVVVLTTRCDARPDLIHRCLAAGKHIIAEKPLSCDSDTDSALVAAIACSGLQIAVNLANRHAWYHELAHAAIAAGEIGAVAAVCVSHQTQGGLPMPANPKPEGPPFENCGMHYIDVLRWFAGDEIEDWHAQGLRLWGHDEPWWVTAHGRCGNGVAVQVTEGFAWAQGCPDRTNCSRFEILGSVGGIVISHDFRTATVEVHGLAGSRFITREYGGKHLDTLLDRFARSLDAGRNLGYATADDCAKASRLARAMQEQAITTAGMARGTPAELALIRERKSTRDRS
jgi:predicted dehydrogenase